jgi:hypothetical protein
VFGSQAECGLRLAAFALRLQSTSEGIVGVAEVARGCCGVQCILEQAYGVSCIFSGLGVMSGLELAREQWDRRSDARAELERCLQRIW